MTEAARVSGRVFISHSWGDKALARRVARRLSHRGVSVWIDESEMQVGDRLSERLTAEIRGSSHLVVVLTAAAAKSKWVTREIETAAGANLAIIPLLAEVGARSDVLDETLGVAITDPLTFEDRMEAVAGTVLGHAPGPRRDPELLAADLRAIADEATELRGLILQILVEGRITHSQLQSAGYADDLRHPAETALIALHERGDAKARYVVSLVAARFYRLLGVGYPVLRRQIALEPEASGPLATMLFHLGDRIARREDFRGAFQLFESVSPRPDQAFNDFVIRNFDRFDDAQKERAVRFAVTPDRGPDGFAIDLAFTLFSRLPDSEALRALWYFWVNDYKFGGMPSKGADTGSRDDGLFFTLMNEAAQNKLAQFDPVMEHFQDCFRRLVRSGDLEKLMGASWLLVTAATRRYVRRAQLAEQLSQGLSSAEVKSMGLDEPMEVALHYLSDAISKDESFDDAYQALRQAVGLQGTPPE